MKITKLGHCCLVIEHKNKKIMTDPGNFSTLQNEITGIDLVLITHEHGDHLHVESLEVVLKNNPQAKVITNSSVGKILAAKGIVFEVLEHGGSKTVEDIVLEAFGTEHEEIYQDFGKVLNTGYFIDNKLFYPGDAYTNPGKAVEILAFPVAGPWVRFKDAINYALAVKPKIAFPVHDGLLVQNRRGSILVVSPKVLEAQGIKFVPLGEGESFEG